MQPLEPRGFTLTLDTKVLLLGLLTAALTAAGVFFQKLNGVRAGNAYVSPWLALAVACFFPTFIIGNKVFLMGGKMSLYILATSATYVFSIAIGRMCFGEGVSIGRWVGCGLIVIGVAVTARG
jgi:hypothetical protein